MREKTKQNNNSYIIEVNKDIIKEDVRTMTINNIVNHVHLHKHIHIHINKPARIVPGIKKTNNLVQKKCLMCNTYKKMLSSSEFCSQNCYNKDRDERQQRIRERREQQEE